MTGCCVVTGVGPGNGLALSRRFASAGHPVAMLARNAERLEALASEVDGGHAYPTDLSAPDSIRESFEAVRRDLGPIRVLIHNAGSGSFGEFMDTTAEDLEHSWRVNTLGLLIAGQEAARDMLAHGGGSIVVIGATASLRGNVSTTAFAAGKAAQRSLAQSMARGLGPKGIHVSLAIIDGVIDIPRTREWLPDKPDDFFLKPDAIAESVYQLTRQDPSAWTFELDLRPFGEKW